MYDECRYHWACDRWKFEEFVEKYDINYGGDFNEVVQRYCNTPDGCCEEGCHSTEKCFSSLGFVVGLPCFLDFLFFFFCFGFWFFGFWFLVL
jgi:hypothetical protein